MLDQHSFSITCHTWFGLYVFEDQVGGGVSNSWVQNYLDFIEKNNKHIFWNLLKLGITLESKVPLTLNLAKYVINKSCLHNQ